MRTIRALGRALVGVAAAMVLVAPSCGGSDPCTPEEHGLGGATSVAVRALPAPQPVAGECAHPRVEVISSDADLRAFYESLPETIAPPSVDFTRERVIVREGSGGGGVAWAVTQGETGVVGILACARFGAVTCGVQVVAVPALVSRAEARVCDEVACGLPRLR